MNTQRLLLIFINLISAITAIYAAIVAFHKRNSTGKPAVYLCAAMGATAIYSLGYTMELASNTLEAILFWVKVEHIGIQLIAPTWLLFALTISGRQYYITTKRIILLLTIPTIMMFSVLSGKVHTNATLTPNAPFPTLSYTKGFFAWTGIIFVSTCLIISFGLFISMYLRSAPAFRKQAKLLLMGAVLPWAGMVISASGLAPYNLDLAPISTSVSGIMVIFGFRHYKILDIVPLARDVIYESMQDGVLVIDGDDNVVDANPALIKIFGNDLRKAIGDKVSAIFSKNQDLVDFIHGNMGESFEMELCSENNNNKYYYCSRQIFSNPQNRSDGIIITFDDHTEVHTLIQKLNALATIDNLTGVYNRRHFYEEMRKEIARANRHGKELTLLLFDIDHYKVINDSHSHAAGDYVLQQVIKLIQQRMRKYDLIGRFGGDEFLILLPETDLQTASIIANELREIIENTSFYFEGQEIRATASFGVRNIDTSILPEVDEIIRDADEAVYKAKQNGRNCIVVSS